MSRTRPIIGQAQEVASILWHSKFQYVFDFGGYMSMNLQSLEAEVLSLSLVDRTHLLERLIGSLDADTEVERVAYGGRTP